MQIAGKLVPVESAVSMRQALNVAFVADLTPHMAERLSPFSSRFEMMRLRLADLLMQLQSVEPTADQRASLVTFGVTATSLHTPTSDFGGLLNTIQGSDASRPFAAPLASEEAATAVYPLGEALQLATQQMLEDKDATPHALVVLASNSPAQPIDLTALSQTFVAERASGRPISLLVIGYGDAAADAEQPATPAESHLAQIASALGGEFIAIREQPSPNDYQRINAAFAAILERGISHRLLVHAPSQPGGSTNIRVRWPGQAQPHRPSCQRRCRRFTWTWMGRPTISCCSRSCPMSRGRPPPRCNICWISACWMRRSRAGRTLNIRSIWAIPPFSAALSPAPMR